MYLVSIDVRVHVVIFTHLIVYEPGVTVVNCWDRLCTLGRAPRTKETLPDFREWCRVTRHPRVFHGLMGVVNGPPGFGASHKFYKIISLEKKNFIQVFIKQHGLVS